MPSLRTVFLAAALLAAFPVTSAAQQPRTYAGASFVVVSQPHGDNQPIGGTTRGSGVSFGVWVTPHIAVESEAMFGGGYSWTYSYNPGPSFSVDVVVSRRDTLFGFQLRGRTHGIEPVGGIAYAHQALARHATFKATTTPYFDDARTDHGIAFVGGLDAPIDVGRHFAVVPTFRLLIRGSDTGAPTFADPLGEQTRTGALLFRYGVGGRVRF